MCLRCTSQCVLLVALLVSGRAQDDGIFETTTVAMLAQGERKMSEYILDVIEHFQGPDPVGIPGADVPDPMRVPDTRKALGFTTMLFKNTTLYGLSKFRILEVNAEIEKMKVTAIMSIATLEAKGICEANTFFSSVNSPFSVKLAGVQTAARASLGVTRDGKLVTTNIEMDISFQSIDMNFENAGAIGFIISSFVNTGGNYLFDSIKPYVLKEAYVKISEEIDKKLDRMVGEMQFPNSITPLDTVIMYARRKIRSMNMDPYKIDDYNSTMGVFSVGLTNVWLTGVSGFERVGNITLSLQNNTVIADFAVGTQRLEGAMDWEVLAFNDMLSRAGAASFSVAYITGRIVLAQSIDTNKRPQLRDLNFEIGNIQTRFNGAGTIDYVIEAAINILPNLLRYQIVQLLEGPLKLILQKELNQLDVEETIRYELPKIDEMQRSGFKLSDLRDITEEIVEDDFFNF